MCLLSRGSLSVTYCLKYFRRTGIIDKLVSSLFRTVTDSSVLELNHKKLFRVFEGASSCRQLLTPVRGDALVGLLLDGTETPNSRSIRLYVPTAHEVYVGNTLLWKI